VFIGGLGPMQRRLAPEWRPRAGLVGAPVLGAVFAVGWTPCVGPMLGTIQSLALSGGSLGTAAALAVCYSVGLGLPFVLLALGLGWATGAVRALKRHIRAINLAGGALLVVVGVLMLTGVWNLAVSALQASIGGYVSPI
jgi:cytochrome c-type biogenesis protein